MINVNSVYTTVQALLNKEQRGYLPPQDFNLFGTQAQLDLFEKMFTDLAHYSVSRKGMVYDTGYSDLKKNIKEQIALFEDTATLVTQQSGTGDDAVDTNIFNLPTNLYRIDTMLYNSDTIIEQIDRNINPYLLKSPLTKPSVLFPSFVRKGNLVTIMPSTTGEGDDAVPITNISLDYIKKPDNVIWNYVSSPALYNAIGSVNFGLHPSMQYKLVSKILQLAGVAVREVDVVTFATEDLREDNQIEKS